MTCPSCGAPNHADFSFCLQCGHPLAQSDASLDQVPETRADMEPVEAGTMAMSAPMFGGPAPSSGGARLRVEQGSVDDPVIGLDRPITIIGRRQGSDVVIHDTNVSRLHAQIRRDGSRLVIEDTNSSNGTMVNDERIERPRELNPGDTIRIGDAVFVVEVEEQPADGPEGSTMALDLDSPMTSLGGAPELIAPGLGLHQPSPLTPPPSIMDPNQTSLAESVVFEEEVSAPPERSATAASEPAPSSSTPDYGSAGSGVEPGPVVSSPSSAPSSASTPSTGGSTAASLEALRQELTEVGQELGTFSGTLGGLADRVERLERALDAATGDLASVADAIRGPDASVLKDLQGIVTEVEQADDGSKLDDVIHVLEQLASQPRDIELLLKLSQQAGAIESALRAHGRLVAAAPRLRTTLARLTS